MTNEPTDEDRANATALHLVLQREPSGPRAVTTIAAALAAERERTERSRDEHWAKWHEEQRDKPWSDGAPEELKRAAAYVHIMSAAAIRALGREGNNVATKQDYIDEAINTSRG